MAEMAAMPSAPEQLVARVQELQEQLKRADPSPRVFCFQSCRLPVGCPGRGQRELKFVAVAPVGGVVSERGIRPGQYAHVGSQIISVVPLDTVWVVANFKETQLTHVVVGQQAEIRVDTYPGTVVKARVESLAPASGAQFSLLPPDNATGNFTKVVQRIPVKLVLAVDNPLAGRLRPGMSVEATILTDTTPPTTTNKP